MVLRFCIADAISAGARGRARSAADGSRGLPLPREVVGVASGPIADGAGVFYDKGCEFCHEISGHGGIRGPGLSDADDRLTGDQILTQILSGAENMPSYTGNLTPDQLQAFLAFLQSRHRLSSAAPGCATAAASRTQ